VSEIIQNIILSTNLITNSLSTRVHLFRAKKNEHQSTEYSTWVNCLTSNIHGLFICSSLVD